jgi:alpha-L-rhamnosidase
VNPVFSYIVEDVKGKTQTKARILVSESADMGKIVFDTGFTQEIDSLAFCHPTYSIHWS